MSATATENLRQLIRKEVVGRRSRFLWQGGEGTGKTTLACHFPNAFGLLAKGETGYDTLRERGLVPQVDTTPEVQSFKGVRDWIEWLRTEDHSYEWLWIDGLGSIERMFVTDLIDKHYKNADEFHDYGRGWKRGGPSWDAFLGSLDKLREERDMGIILISHSDATLFNNPKGDDYHRWQPDLSKTPLNLTVRWADGVFFFDFDDKVVTAKGSRKAKGTGGNRISIHTQRTAAYVAKNRHGLPPVISAGTCGSEAFGNFIQAMEEGKKS